jgi:hypothetical protein
MQKGTNPMTDFVSVPVPIERVQEVYELLARRSPRRSAAPQITDGGYPAGWSEALIDRMYVESSGAMRGILVAVAKKSPYWVTTAEIAEACNVTARQVIASLGPFEKRVRGRYGMDRWPFEAREFVDAGLRKYSMSPGTASRIVALTERVEHHERGAE